MCFPLLLELNYNRNGLQRTKLEVEQKLFSELKLHWTQASEGYVARKVPRLSHVPETIQLSLQ